MQDSHFEEKAHRILVDLDYNFEEEYEFDDLISSSGRHLRFDFAIFDDNDNLKCLIELQGRQHYIAIPKFGGSRGLKRQQYNDSLKKQYCLKNRIKLICIPYTKEGLLNANYLMNLIEQ